jgi:hypothetical protein
MKILKEIKMKHKKYIIRANISELIHNQDDQRVRAVGQAI